MNEINLGDVLNPTTSLSYSLALLTGLLGSAHCLGMCGGLVSAFFLNRRDGGWLPCAAYHGARLSVYVLIGMISAALGGVLLQTGILGKAQGLLQIAAGLVVILLGLDLLGWSPWPVTVGFAPVAWLRRQFAQATRRGVLQGALFAGAVNGLMPCAMTLAMAVKATTAANPVEGGLLLLAFGVGTLPSMLFVSLFFGKLGVRARGYLLRGAALLVIGFGVATVYQGLAYYNVMRRLANG